MSFILGTEKVLLVTRSFEIKSGKAHFAIIQENTRLRIPRFQFRFPCLRRKWPVDWIIIFISMSNLPKNVKQSAFIFHNVSLHSKVYNFISSLQESFRLEIETPKIPRISLQ